MVFFKHKYIVIVIGLIFASTQISAEDLGVVGQTYEIKEPDAVEQIQAKLMAMQQSGELDKLKKEAINRSLNSLKNPKPNDSLKTALESSTYLYDPTKFYSENVVDEEGNILVPAGTKINPLNYVGLSKTLIFFDGRDADQVSAVKKIVDTKGEKVKPILVAGSWYDISKKWGRQVYYDQGRYLADEFSLEEVPAVIYQEKDMLRVDVIPSKELVNEVL